VTRICGRCRAAENPNSKLKFVESPEGALCEGCFSRHYNVPDPGFSGPSDDLVVITCPDCRGRHHAPSGFPCQACAGYGAVRIAKNALVVYKPGKPRVLTED